MSLAATLRVGVLMAAGAFACTQPPAAPPATANTSAAPPPAASQPAEPPPAAPSAALVAPGTYNGRPPHHVGLLQLKVREDGTATFLHLVSVHLPPTELERREVRLERGPDGRVCMSPVPNALEPCLTQEKDGVLTVKARAAAEEGTTVRLERVPPR